MVRADVFLRVLWQFLPLEKRRQFQVLNDLRINHFSKFFNEMSHDWCAPTYYILTNYMHALLILGLISATLCLGTKTWNDGG